MTPLPGALVRLMAWWDRRTCKHGRGAAWRPAKTSAGPARFCNHCERVEQLSEAEFYAYFGRPSVMGFDAGGFNVVRTQR